MHYNHDNGVYCAYMLEDYTEELASQHSVRNLIGDEFTLANLKSRFEEIMSMNVEPSVNTTLLNVKFDWEGNMIDKTSGNVVEDIWSIHSWEYQEQQVSGTSGSEDTNDYNSSEDYENESDEDDSSDESEDSYNEDY